MELSVCPVPSTLRPEQLQGAVVVIDVLRMTSVAVEALSNGCVGLRPAAEVEEARVLARAHGALLGGERKALALEGFDFSNSPLEYGRERVGGRGLVMSTSNGTQALAAVAGAQRVLLAGLINARAVARALMGEERVCLVCAGTHGAFSLEDALAAGAIGEELPGARCDDMALACRGLFRQAKGDLHQALAETRHYGYLKGLGFDGDLDFCLTLNSHGAVPEQDADGWFRLKGEA